MTAQYQCDRCGDPIEGEPIVLVSLRFVIAKRSPRGRVDLCPSCGDSFMAWMNELELARAECQR